MADADLFAGRPDPAAEDNKGHRARLRGRLLAKDGGDALLDHEVIEYLLALTLPRIDTKPLAKTLIREFGGLGGVFAADPDTLVRVPGVGEGAVAAIRIVAAAINRVLQAEVAKRPVLANWQALLDYLRASMAHHAVERVRVLHLNTRNMLIRDEQMSQGTIDEAPLHVREVIRRAIDLGSASLILVHNHPSGDPSPSRADIEVTRAIVDAGKPLGIAVHDQIVMGTTGHVSLKSKGLI